MVNGMYVHTYRIRMPVGYRRVSSMCEPWQGPPQDHPKGLVHGTGIAICSDKDSFYLPFFTRMQLYVLTNSIGLTQKRSGSHTETRKID